MNRRLPLIFIGIFAVLTMTVFLIKNRWPAFDLAALITANALMLILALAAFAMLRRNVGERAHAFARGVQGATKLRLFVCAGGILAYALIKRPDVHKPTLFLMFGIYAAYTIVETLAFSRQARKNG